MSSLLSVLFWLLLFFQNKQSLNKQAYYKAIESSDTMLINQQLQKLYAAKNAYTGALLMKKAGLASKPASKLNLFKQGKTLLEEDLKADEKNIEYHFLRLLVQENAPKILNYNNDIEKDTEYIRLHFNSLSAEVQAIVKNYSLTSKALKGL